MTRLVSRVRLTLATASPRRSFCTSRLHLGQAASSPPNPAHEGPSAIDWANLTVSCPRETFPFERRVALTPANVSLLLKKGFGNVKVAQGAGIESSFPDEAYLAAGASIVSQDEALADGDVVLKLRPPNEQAGESTAFKNGATILSFLYPAQNTDLVGKLQQQGLTTIAMDCVPRISRAQVRPCPPKSPNCR